MIQTETIHINSTPVYYRLVALWVVCEAVLGGIIHGLKLPVSGLVVGSSAVICICLIAWHVPKKGVILQATLLVAIFKMMLSPHSPLPAYFAVFFQGLMGEILFFRRLNYKISCMLLACIALMESALQRILVVTLLYGRDIWTAVNDFVNGFVKSGADFSYGLIVFYLAAHLFAGIIIGWFAGRLPQKIRRWESETFVIETGVASDVVAEKKKGGWKAVFFIVWILLLLLLLQSSFANGNAFLPANRIIQILARSSFIILSWYFFLSPLLTRFLKTWLATKQKKAASAVSEITKLLPFVRYIVLKSWQLSASRKNLKRLVLFCRLVLTNTLRNA